jgi:UDPglucose 6-dehydrogenase
MNKENLLIGFIGQGFIGKNMADDFESRGFAVVRYNKGEFNGNKERIKDCDFVFIAVPTPSTPSGFDDSILEEVLALVGEGKTAIIKSTIKIGTTEKFQKMFPNKYIIHSPEFLTEKNAAFETKYPPRNVIGYSEKSRVKAEEVLKILPTANFSYLVNSREAELVKYMGNNFLFLKVIFANIMYNLAKRKGLDYNLVAEIVGKDPRIGSSHLKIQHQSGLSEKKGRGAGGHCFIKDMSALVEMFKEDNTNTNKEDILSLELLEKIVELNKQLLLDSEKDLDLLEGVYGKLNS